MYPACIENKIPEELKDLGKAEGLARAKGTKRNYFILMKANTVGQAWVWGGEGSEIVKEIYSGRKSQVERAVMGGSGVWGWAHRVPSIPALRPFSKHFPRKQGSSLRFLSSHDV